MHPLKPLARSLRRNQTDAERKLWFHLRNRQLAGVKFNRQIPIGKYIADFISYENNLIIEIDGGQHNDDSQKQRDIERSKWLKMKGYKVLRFWNNDILNNLDDVLESIHLTLTLSSKERE
jgi:very-short-patch-repair endonuclease